MLKLPSIPLPPLPMPGVGGVGLTGSCAALDLAGDLVARFKKSPLAAPAANNDGPFVRPSALDRGNAGNESTSEAWTSKEITFVSTVSTSRLLQ